MAQEKSVFDLSGGDLDVLLAWHQAPKKKGDKKKDKLEQWVEIRWSMKPPPPYNKWTDQDEQKRTALMSDEVDMADTFFGRELALKEKEFEAAVVNMSREKRDAIKHKLAEMENNDGDTSAVVSTLTQSV